ncbi:MAG: DEAD/DEAH box helicase family protein [Pseudomonadota bacterium]
MPTRVLLDQWHRVISGFYRGTVGRLGDGERTIAPVTVATFASEQRHMQSLGNRFRMLVVDEAHHFGGRMQDEALEMCVADMRLGLTATPPDTDDAGAAGRLSLLIGPVVYKLVIGDLAGSFLANFDLMTISVDLNARERRRYDEAMALFSPVFKRFRSVSPSSDWRDFMRWASRTPQGRRALQARLRARKVLAFPGAKAEALSRLLKRHQRSRVLVFTADNETAYEVARTHLIMPLTCDIGRAERDDALERFRTGRLRALVSSRVLFSASHVDTSRPSAAAKKLSAISFQLLEEQFLEAEC